MVLDSNKKFLNAAILIQYVPRVLRICLSWRKIISTDNQLSRIVWVKAAFNFFLYIIASQVKLDVQIHSISFDKFFFGLHNLLIFYWLGGLFLLGIGCLPSGTSFLSNGRQFAGMEPVKIKLDAPKVLSTSIIFFFFLFEKNCDHSSGNHSFINDYCSVATPNATFFDFGIFLKAIQSGIVTSTNFPKISRSVSGGACEIWGLQIVLISTCHQ